MSTLVKTTWAIDPTHSEVEFKIKHLVISTVKGIFKEFTGAVDVEGEDFTTAEFHFEANVDSIFTNQADRDGHLKSADFFDVANYPKISFTSTEVTKKSEDTYTITGELTVKDITRTVHLTAEFGGVATDPYGNVKAGFEITGAINRKDFGLTFHAVTEAGNIVLGEDIKLNINVQFAKQA
jgi:polyisoprenoid-binding protein YceI